MKQKGLLKFFSSKLLGFTQSPSGASNDPPQGFVQKITAPSKSEKPFNIFGIGKIHLRLI